MWAQPDCKLPCVMMHPCHAYHCFMWQHPEPDSVCCWCGTDESSAVSESRVGGGIEALLWVAVGNGSLTGVQCTYVLTCILYLCSLDV